VCVVAAVVVVADSFVLLHKTKAPHQGVHGF
jgi:hypothetical protein